MSEPRPIRDLLPFAETSIFPIFRVLNAHEHQLLATGFFLSNSGLFLTARHVVDVLIVEGTGVMSNESYIVHTSDAASTAKRALQRRVSWIRTHRVTDIAGGYVEPRQSDDGVVIPDNVIGEVDVSRVADGTKIWTVGFHETTVTNIEGHPPHIELRSALIRGTILEYFRNGTDDVMKPFPTYCTSMVVPRGASGGPVFTDDGRLFAINTTGFDGADELSFVAALSPLHSHFQFKRNRQ